MGKVTRWVPRSQAVGIDPDDPGGWIDPLWERADAAPSEAEIRFAQLWASLYPDLDLMAQFKFHPDRRFRFDFCNQPAMVAIEIQGGTWMATSGHNSGKGIEDDYEKMAEAIALGWVVFPLTTEQSTDLKMLARIAQTIEKRLEGRYGF